MADVTRDEGRAGRGQLILVTALSLAILFVTLALIVNTAIYTENLATRGSDIGGGTEAVRYHDAARAGTGGLMEYANYQKNDTNSSIRTELNDGVDALDNRTGRLFAMSDRAVSVSIDGTVNGTRIAQTNTTREYTNEALETNWTVVEDVTNTRAFTINVTDATPLEAPNSGDEFQLVVQGDGGEQWILNVTNDGSNPVGITNASGETFTCSGDATPIINVSAGTVDGSDCDGLVFAEGLDTPYQLAFENGDNVTGTYSFIVDNDTLAGNVGTNPNLAAPGDQPFATHAVYSTNLTVVYQTPQLYFNATARVAPEEADG